MEKVSRKGLLNGVQNIPKKEFFARMQKKSVQGYFYQRSIFPTHLLYTKQKKIQFSSHKNLIST